MSSNRFICPNPDCPTSFATARGLQCHLTRSRRRLCSTFMLSLNAPIDDQTTEFDMAPASVRHSSSMPIAIEQEYDNPNKNYTSLALLVPLVPTNIDNVTTTNQNEEIDVLVNDDNASMGGMDDMEEEDEHFFMHSTHQKSSAKLMLLLDSWGVPNDAFQHIVEWYEMSRLHDVSFNDKSKSREANLEELRCCIPQQLACRWLPHTVPVQLLGFCDTVDLVRFDAVVLVAG